MPTTVFSPPPSRFLWGARSSGLEHLYFGEFANSSVALDRSPSAALRPPTVSVSHHPFAAPACQPPPPCFFCRSLPSSIHPWRPVRPSCTTRHDDFRRSPRVHQLSRQILSRFRINLSRMRARETGRRRTKHMGSVFSGHATGRAHALSQMPRRTPTTDELRQDGVGVFDAASSTTINYKKNYSFRISHTLPENYICWL